MRLENDPQLLVRKIFCRSQSRPDLIRLMCIVIDYCDIIKFTFDLKTPVNTPEGRDGCTGMFNRES